MKTKDFWYDLPAERIAQYPMEPRDHSRLLVVNRQSGVVEHRRFYHLPEYLTKGDALVLNETKVLPARLMGVRHPTGGAAELLLLRRIDIDTWEALCRPGRRIREGDLLLFGDGLLRAEVISRTDAGGRIVRFLYEGVFEQLLDHLGTMPLPPYITEQLDDQARYQTVYATQTGSAAAPTAGLHFTRELLGSIQDMGVSIVPVLLHVGLGTFRPVQAEDIEEHDMHSEWYEMPESSAQRINATKAGGSKVFCVGTTSVRTLETVTDDTGVIHPDSGETSIFISPGYRFKAVDALITNFHLPESSLLMLVSALMGREMALCVYRKAIDMEYRFFSFGDAMLIL